MLVWMKRMGWRFGALALAALLMRAILPAGYMLAHADDGRYLTVQMCEGHAPAQVIDLDTGKLIDPSDLPSDAGDASDGSPCIFASTASVATPVAGAEPAAFLATQDADFAIVRDLRPGRGIAAPPPPSTGPPSTI